MQYTKFWQDPSAAPLDWIALLFMVVALGIFFSSFIAPHELALDTDPKTPLEQFKILRQAAGQALVWGRYTQPSLSTIPPFILYLEAEFLINRASQMSCYLLSAVNMRLMLKMGFHRDPSKLANISPFEGEMRRRMWNMGMQVDLLVSFHMGLPSMVYGVESDTVLPRNLLDEDFDGETTELPLGRSAGDYTHMSYSICKTSICKVFGLIARQAHSLASPVYSEVLKLDAMLDDTWSKIPDPLKVLPLEECVTRVPMQIIQSFGLAALYQKSRCVLHRRYLSEAIPKKEHDYSRRICLEAALKLLDYQYTISIATRPGNILSQHGWFVSSLAVHDFLLASMIVYVVVQSSFYSEVGDNYEWLSQPLPTPTKEELIQILKRSLNIWSDMAEGVPELKKVQEILNVMLYKLHGQGDPPLSVPTGMREVLAANPGANNGNGASSSTASWPSTSSKTLENKHEMGPYLCESTTINTHRWNLDTTTPSAGSAAPAPAAAPTPSYGAYSTNMLQPAEIASQGFARSGALVDSSWVAIGDEVDWVSTPVCSIVFVPGYL
jgi:hypothetical protein